MSAPLLSDIDKFQRETGIGDFRFGFLATKNGRLMERLRSGRRIWPETETKIRAFMIAERRQRSVQPERASA